MKIIMQDLGVSNGLIRIRQLNFDIHFYDNEFGIITASFISPFLKINFNGQIDGNESDPTRREDTGDFDEDGIDNWEENLTCTEWNNADTDYGGVLDGDEVNPLHGTDPCDSLVDAQASILSWGAATLTLSDSSPFNPNGGKGWYESTSGILTEFSYASRVGNQLTNVDVAPVAGDIVLAKDGYL